MDIKKKIEEIVENVNIPYVCGIDIGYKKMGFGVLNYHDEFDVPILEKTSILFAKDGRVYMKYLEKICHELVYNFMKERWHYMKRSKLIRLEKQMTRLKSNEERACICIEQCIKSYLYMKMAEGGPPFEVVPPRVWRQQMGITALPSEVIPSRVVNGVFHQSDVNLNRNEHKEQSREKFCDLSYTDNQVKYIRDKFPGLGSDEIEAYMIARTGINNIVKCLTEALITSHHSKNIFSTKKNVSKSERMIKISKFDEDDNIDLAQFEMAPPKKKRKTQTTLITIE